MKFDINYLEEVLKVQTSTYKNTKMLAFIKRELNKMDDVVFTSDKKKNIYATKGSADVYPCFVAHTDTVHQIVPESNFMLFHNKNILFSIDSRKWKRCGIGGDDKVGVYIALEMMKQMPIAKAAFFVDEEIGCVGSREADLKFFKDVNVCMQADRQGVREITSSINGVEMWGEHFYGEIESIINEHNFSEVDGGTTDVGQLGSALKSIPMFNVACGYYLPHTENEYVNVRDIHDTMFFLEAVYNRVVGQVYNTGWKRESYSYNSGWDFHFGTAATDVSKQDKYDRFLEDWRSRQRDEQTPRTVCKSCKGSNLMRGVVAEETYCNDCGQYHYDEDNSTPF